MAIFQKCAIFVQFFVYPFKPRPLKNVPIHDMVTLHANVVETPPENDEGDYKVTMTYDFARTDGYSMWSYTICIFSSIEA